jgi:hypothetical protein
MTPLQAFSGQVPSLDSLITFGAKITATKLGNRPTTLNPWFYNGIFLGYQNTMHNIKYWGASIQEQLRQLSMIRRIRFNLETTHQIDRRHQSS